MTAQQKVDAFIAKKVTWSEELSLLRSLLLKTSLEEAVKWGMPTYTINNKNVVGLGCFKEHVGLWFFQGVFLEDKANKLRNAQEGKTKGMRQWRFESMTEVKNCQKLIVQYVKEAINNQEAGRVVKSDRNKVVAMPQELKDFLAEKPAMKTAFNNLTSSKQREYKEYINEAKMSATKTRRLEKITSLVLAGKGLNDKYR